MNKHIALAVFTLTAVTGVARAAEPGHDDRRIFEINFKCEFNSELTTLPFEGGNPANGMDDREIKAYAKVFALVSHDDWSSSLEQDRNRVNRFAVIRRDRLEYANALFLESSRELLKVSGENGSPLIVIKRRDHDMISNQWVKYEATFSYGEENVRGICEIHAEPADHPDVLVTMAVQ